ncbi:ABC transporter permease [Alkalihalophilus pseudofirmus]|uniref:ABC transporter permease n=1 Tax=Alkalihalophilus pseudofirmus TaxID=79885 RepID=A0AAJ2NJT0_ALKPS|nr:ABC transporter permease subunit [Alkalihalophilus pseudofirmus]MDV2883624.1 ABC transporter permease [Alkalihalophilus pseudofirmus]
MRQWVVLFQKEVLEMTRNYKLIWVPIVFILLGMTDPLTTYYMPQILEMSGGLPEGAVFEMPTPAAQEVLMMVISQLNMLGVLIIVLASMGIISEERRSGLAGMILVKPVSYASYVTAKWAALSIVGLLSLFLGYLAGWYYVVVLFEAVSFAAFLQSYLLLALWFLFIFTLIILFNAALKVPGLVAFVTLTTIIILSIMTSTFESWMEWSPAQLTSHLGSILVEETVPQGLWLTVSVTVILIIVFFLGSIKILQNKELSE